MEYNRKIPWKRIVVAAPVCIGLAALVCMIPWYPCGYFDAATEKYAGYGYTSLSGAIGSGFSWDSATVPVPYEEYAGTGPYVAEANAWVALLFIPIFLAVAYLGLEIVRGNVRMPTPSTSSAGPRARTPLFRRSR